MDRAAVERVEIELHARRGEDLPTLRALHRALEQAGESARLSVSSGVPRDSAKGIQSGPVPCRVRVLVESDAEAPRAEAEHCVVVEDVLATAASFSQSERPSDTLARADLILVPGPERARELAARVSGDVIACGLARLDPLWRDQEGERARARRELGIPESANLVLYAPTGDPSRSAVTVLGDEVAQVAAAGWLVLILPQGWPPDWVERHQALAARVPGSALLEAGRAMSGLAAADLVLSDGGSLIYEAAALRKGAIWVERRDPSPGSGPLCPRDRYGDLGPRIRDAEELGAALQSMISARVRASRAPGARASALGELLVCEGGAAGRMADEISARFGSSRASKTCAGCGSESEVLEKIEARFAFGDTEGALEAIEARIAADSTPASLLLLASIHRREGDVEAARRAVRRAEPMARGELGRVFCERGRIHVDANEPDAARAAFEEAREVAPDLADPWVGIGSLALHSGDAATAERQFCEALSREKSARTWCGLGLALVEQERGVEAISAFESALDLEADRMAAVYGLVQAAFQSGELARAECRLGKFIELHSGNLDMTFTLAALRYQLGDREGAQEMAERIELFQPDYPGLRELREKLEL